MYKGTFVNVLNTGSHNAQVLHLNPCVPLDRNELALVVDIRRPVPHLFVIIRGSKKL